MTTFPGKESPAKPIRNAPKSWMVIMGLESGRACVPRLSVSDLSTDPGVLNRVRNMCYVVDSVSQAFEIQPVLKVAGG